jgi:hypothetical protein
METLTQIVVILTCLEVLIREIGEIYNLYLVGLSQHTAHVTPNPEIDNKSNSEDRRCVLGLLFFSQFSEFF